MAKQNKTQGNDLLAMALASTTKNITKTRNGSSKTTYLDRFVKNLLDENGQPVPLKSRVAVVAEVSLEIALEQREAQIAEGLDVQEFMLTAEGDSADDEIFAAINKRVKNQLNSAVANNNNATSLSYNEAYKDVWSVVKEKGCIALVAKTSDVAQDSPGNESEES